MTLIRILVPLIALLTIASAAIAQPADGAWRSLPLIENGQVAKDWVQIGWGGFAVEDGALRTECDERGMGLLLYQKEKFGDCQIRVVYRSKDARSNAGVFVRIDDGVLKWIGKKSVAVERESDGGLSDESLEKMKDASENDLGPWYAVHHGYEIQICDEGDAYHRTGAVYSLAKAELPPQKPPTEWKTMIITLQGNRVVVEIDGRRVTAFDPDSPDVPRERDWYEPKREPQRPTAGYLGLQNHDPGDVVYFKEVAVRPRETK